MQELNLIEIEEVSGASIMATIGYYVGYIWGAGAATQQSIDSMDNSMLGAMQYGA